MTKLSPIFVSFKLVLKSYIVSEDTQNSLLNKARGSFFRKNKLNNKLNRLSLVYMAIATNKTTYFLLDHGGYNQTHSRSPKCTSKFICCSTDLI